MGTQIIFLTLTLLTGGVGFGCLACGMNAHILGEIPCAKCVTLTVMGSLVVLAAFLLSLLFVK